MLVILVVGGPWKSTQTRELLELGIVHDRGAHLLERPGHQVILLEVYGIGHVSGGKKNIRKAKRKKKDLDLLGGKILLVYIVDVSDTFYGRRTCTSK